MKVVFGMVLIVTTSCSVAIFGQDAVTAAMAACGPKDDKVKVNPDIGRDPSAQAESGKALVYIIADDGATHSVVGAGIARELDWMGPGLEALVHIEAQADKVYYFRVRQWDTRYQMFLDLDPIDSDMGKFFLASLSAKK